jgi:hypothetical protein
MDHEGTADVEAGRMIKVTVRMFAYDVDQLKSFYPGTGYNRVLRALARRHVRALEAQLAKRLSPKELEQGGEG